MDEYNIFFSVINGNLPVYKMSECNKTTNYKDFQNFENFITFTILRL